MNTAGEEPHVPRILFGEDPSPDLDLSEQLTPEDLAKEKHMTVERVLHRQWGRLRELEGARKNCLDNITLILNHQHNPIEGRTGDDLDLPALWRRQPGLFSHSPITDNFADEGKNTGVFVYGGFDPDAEVEVSDESLFEGETHNSPVTVAPGKEGRIVITPDMSNFDGRNKDTMTETMGAKPSPESETGQPTLIKCKTPEGKEVSFDLEKEREYWVKFYEAHNLSQLVKTKEGKTIIPETIVLTPQQIRWVKDKVEKHGFNRMMICPPVSTQKQSMSKVKREMGKPVEGLQGSDQYSREDDGVWYSDRVKEGIADDKIEDVREDRPYIKLWKDDAEVDNEGETGEYYSDEFTEQGLHGDTQFEYLLAQREFSEKTGRHLDTRKWGWLTDSVVKDDNGAVRFLLDAYWNPNYQRVNVHAYQPSNFHPDGGARASAILYLDNKEAGPVMN